MRTGEAARAMGVDAGTIRNWIANEELDKFFSDGAKAEHGGTQRVLNEEDVLILNTIRQLRSVGVAEWNVIAQRLDSGYRFQEFPQNAVSFDNRMIPIPQAKQAAEVVQMQAERDAALQALTEKENEIERLRSARETDALEIRRLEREIGKLQAQVEMLREMTDGKRSE